MRCTVDDNTRQLGVHHRKERRLYRRSARPQNRHNRRTDSGAAGPVWMHGLDLKCRKGGEKGWDKDTKNWSLEIFRDENTG